ncbi:Hypothetical predicted protein, partial [Marmota monax]
LRGQPLLWHLRRSPNFCPASKTVAPECPSTWGLASVFSSRTSRKSVSRAGDDDDMAEGEGYRNPTEVQMSQLVLPCHTNHRGELSVGQLLKWIDTMACLSAERHAGCPCVTASMDDIYFEHTISVGQVVNIKAKVNRAFNSSMEVGIQVASEDLCSEKQWNVCKALATFVAHRELTKVKLKQITPRTEEEKTEHSVAAERRRMRLVYADTIKGLLANYAIQEDLDSRDCSCMVPAEKTRVESVELVLPPHANHQGNTFGGQIMAWMENVATIAASRLCRGHPTLKAIEMFHFRGPSQVGDRLVLKAIVNNAFKHRPCLAAGPSTSPKCSTSVPSSGSSPDSPAAHPAGSRVLDSTRVAATELVAPGCEGAWEICRMGISSSEVVHLHLSQ